MSNIVDDSAVEVQLGGETKTLQVTANAALSLSKLYGGIAPILGKIQSLDVEAYVNVVRYGLNLSDEEARGLTDKVFEAGLVSLIQPLTDYIQLIAMGGVKSADKEQSEKKQESS